LKFLTGTPKPRKRDLKLIKIALFSHKSCCTLLLPKLQPPQQNIFVILYRNSFVDPNNHTTLSHHDFFLKNLKNNFSSLLILLTCVLAAVAYLEYSHHDQIRKEYLDQFTNSIVKYNATDGTNQTDWVNDGEIYTSEDVDRIQTMLECCGSYNYTDFSMSPWGLRHPQMVPMSCCDPDEMSKSNKVYIRVFLHNFCQKAKILLNPFFNEIMGLTENLSSKIRTTIFD